MAKMAREIQLIPIDLVVANKNQPRKYFDEDSINELAESIKGVGIIQPLSVKEAYEGKFVLISGERRLRASKVAGLTKVPCVIIRADALDSELMALIENIQREDLNYVDEARAYVQLINNYGFTQKQLAEKVGKKQSTISNKMRLLKLGSEVLALAVENRLTERHARALLSIPDTAARIKTIRTIKEKELNVRQTEDLVLRIKGEVLLKSSNKRIKNVINYRIYTNTIKQAYDVIKKTGIDVDYDEKQFDDRVEVKIVIPLDKK